MDVKVNIAAARLVNQALIRGSAKIPSIPFLPQKTVAYEKEEPLGFPVTSPRRAGLSERALFSLISCLSQDRKAHIHSFFLLVDGKLVLEGAAPAYSPRIPHATFSMCKTVTGLAIAMLLEEGKLSLDDKAASFFPELRVPARMKGITIKHLLCMQSGVIFGETGAVTETNWPRAFFESGLRFEPGTSFSYNSMNSYMLAAIHTRVTGISLSAFLEERLWKPLGIKDVLWETCPQGVEKGGWGLYLSAQSMAKIGQLFLQKGVFRGKRLISEERLAEAVGAHTAVPERVGAFDYGYHLWTHRNNESYLFNGMLGQNVWVYPKRKVVLAFTAEEPCVFQDAEALTKAMDVLTKDESWKRERLPFYRLRMAGLLRRFAHRVSWLSLRHLEHHPYPFPLGLYHLPQNNASLMPLLCRLVQNNHTDGIKTLRLEEKRKGVLQIQTDEGKGVYTVYAKRHQYLHQTLDFNGEKYRVAAAYEVAADENRLPVLKIELKFPELPVTRRILLRLTEDGPQATFTETPGASVVSAVASSAFAGIFSQNFLTDFISAKLRPDFLFFRIGKTFSPAFALLSAPAPAANEEEEDEEDDGENTEAHLFEENT